MRYTLEDAVKTLDDEWPAEEAGPFRFALRMILARHAGERDEIRRLRDRLARMTLIARDRGDACADAVSDLRVAESALTATADELMLLRARIAALVSGERLCVHGMPRRYKCRTDTCAEQGARRGSSWQVGDHAHGMRHDYSIYCGLGSETCPLL